MTTPNDVARHAAGPDPHEVRSHVQALLGQLDSSASLGDAETELDLEAQAQVLEQAHDVLVRALESAEQG
ncbi:ethanolamine utilization microcompartment shell protein EutL [Mycobacteroides chelonae]|nr:ethanolamine utilization microcompartment shell protein EutL [Mycobacteroides chelonae]